MKNKERPESKKQQSTQNCKRQGDSRTEARPENKQPESKQ